MRRLVSVVMGLLLPFYLAACQSIPYRDAPSTAVENASAEAITFASTAERPSAYLLDPASRKLQSWSRRAPLDLTSRVSASDLAADLRGLRASLLAVYPFSTNPDAFSPAQAQAIFAAAIERCAGSGTVALSEVLVPLLAHWRFATGDRHFQLQNVAGLEAALQRVGWRRSLSRPVFVSADPATTAPACRWVDSIPLIYPSAPCIWRTRMRNEMGQWVPVWMLSAFADSTPQLVCEGQPVPLQPVASVAENARYVNAPDQPAYRFELQNGTAWIRLHSFSSRFDRELRRFVEDVARHRKARRLVVDLRGNGGGNNRYAYEWFNALTAQPRVVGTASQRYSADVAALRANRAVLDWLRRSDAGRQEAGAALPKELLRVFAEVAQAPRTAVEQTGNMEWGGSAERDYTGRIWVLVDRHTASSAENLVLALRELPTTRIVGEPTGGLIEAGEVGLVVLPRSGLVWGIPTKRFSYDTLPICAEGVGIPVDVYLPDLPDNPLEALQASGLFDSSFTRP